MIQVVTTVVGTACYPLDTIRRRIMMQVSYAPWLDAVCVYIAVYGPDCVQVRVAEGGDYLYQGGWHCFRQIMATEGTRGLFRGLSANLLRGVGGSLLLVGYDEARSLLSSTIP